MRSIPSAYPTTMLHCLGAISKQLSSSESVISTLNTPCEEMEGWMAKLVAAGGEDQERERGTVEIFRGQHLVRADPVSRARNGAGQWRERDTDGKGRARKTFH